MRTSANIDTLSTALLVAQKAMEEGAKKDSENPYFHSKYADFNAVLEACKEALNENGILILQPHIVNEYGLFVETILVHAKSGQWAAGETKIECSKPNDPQALGSAITYARRYGLQSFIVLPSEDDDGEAGVGRGKPAQKALSLKKPQQDVPQSELTKFIVAMGDMRKAHKVLFGHDKYFMQLLSTFGVESFEQLERIKTRESRLECYKSLGSFVDMAQDLVQNKGGKSMKDLSEADREELTKKFDTIASIGTVIQ